MGLLCLGLQIAVGQTTQKYDVSANLPVQSFAIGDIDGDNLVDVVAGSSNNPNFNNQRRIVWYKMDVQGNLYDEHAIADTPAEQILLADLNNDGYPEVVSAYSAALKVDYNAGCGYFDNSVVYNFVGILDELIAGDFNGDGFVDVAAYSNNSIRVFYNDTNGGLNTPQTVVSGVPGTTLSSGDLDQSGTDDLAYTQNGDARYLLGNTNNTFEPPVTVDFAPLFIEQVKLALFDQDSTLDIVGREDQGSTSQLGVALNVNGTYTANTLVSTLPYGSKDFAIADIDTNGHQDIVLEATNDNSYVFLNDDLNNFTSFIARSGSIAGGQGILFVHDFNHDLKPDLLVRNSNEVKIHFNTGNTSAWNINTQISERRTFGQFSIAVGDLNGDNLPDVLCSDGGALIYFQDSLGHYAPAFDVIDAGDLQGPIIADMNNDGLNDIISGDGHDYSWYENTGGSFIKHTISSLLSSQNSIAVGDFDGDLDLDVAFNLNAGSQFQLNVMANDGLGNFSFNTSETIQGSYVPQSTVFADINNDTYMDVIFAGGNRIGYLRGTPVNTFDSTFVIYDNLDGFRNLEVVDLDGDSILDLLVADLDSVEMFYNQGAANFTREAYRTSPFNTHAVAAGDLDNDGDTDFYYADFESLYYVRQDAPHTYTSFLVADDDLPRKLFISDANQDSTLDVFALSANEIAMHTTQLPTCVLSTSCSTSASFTATDNGAGNYDFQNTGTDFAGAIWDFGDGNTSTALHPNHTYAANGNYIVTLINLEAPGGGCRDTVTSSLNVTSVAPPCTALAAFNIVDNGNGNYSFTNNSTGSDLVAFWDFGDGSTSTDYSPSHTYLNNGSYTVDLMVTDTSIAGGTCNSIVSDTVVVTGLSPVCNLSASYTFSDNGTGNFTFTNTSTGTNTAVAWAFGDGGTSTANNPDHIFAGNGAFVVVLTLEDTTHPNGTCFDFFIDTIQVSGVINPVTCAAAFVAYPDTATNSVTVVNNALGSNLTYLWDFGDGNTSTQQFPSYTYGTNGPFNLCLTIDDGAGCTSTYCDSVGANGFVLRDGFDINVIPRPTSISINEMDLANAVTLYPNPASTEITVQSDMHFTVIELLDVTGKTILKQRSKTIDVSSLSNGMYLLKVRTDRQIAVKRFIKK